MLLGAFDEDGPLMGLGEEGTKEEANNYSEFYGPLSPAPAFALGNEAADDGPIEVCKRVIL